MPSGTAADYARQRNHDMTAVPLRYVPAVRIAYVAENHLGDIDLSLFTDLMHVTGLKYVIAVMHVIAGLTGNHRQDGQNQRHQYDGQPSHTSAHTVTMFALTSTKPAST